jgi:hypothetical protein
MSVNQISQSHAHQAEATQNVNSQKSQNATTKANAIQGNPQAQTTHSKPAAQTVGKNDNPAGSEQGRQQNAENDTNGKRVNVFV